MIILNTPAASSVLKQYDFSLPQAEFLAAGSYTIPVGGGVFMMLMYVVNNFNNTWNTNDPVIRFVSDPIVFNAMVLTYAGGNSSSSPTFTKYGDFNIDATIAANSATIQWDGNPGLIAGAEFMNFSLFYVTRTI